MKKILVTSTDLMMIQFLAPHIINLSKNGYIIDIACSNVGDRINDVKNTLNEYTNNIFIVDLKRSPSSINNRKGIKELKQIINKNTYELIWTNEPVMGVSTRIASKKARNKGTKVMYMVHGMHFFKGAPLINWLLFYPIEKFMSRYCDTIVTINKEDYEMAKTFYSKDVKYIHGIGVNTDRLNKKTEQSNIREELNIAEDSFIVLSVGELNENKNHRIILNALNQINDNSIHYVVCGKGDQYENLLKLCDELNISSNVHFLGYRNDVVDICSQSDLFAFPTFREGLGLAALEAMYCGLPLVTSNVRGPVDFMINGETGYICDPNSPIEFSNAIKTIRDDSDLQIKMGEKNKDVVIPFCIDNVKKEVVELISNQVGE